jgi:hypothetical protein
MSILGRFIKQPAEKESYSIEYADDLVGSDAIASTVTTVLPIGLTIVSTLIVGTRVKVLVEGGAAVGTKHKVTVTATTDDGRVLQDEFIISIKDY